MPLIVSILSGVDIDLSPVQFELGYHLQQVLS